MAKLQFQPTTIVNNDVDRPYQFLDLFSYHSLSKNQFSTFNFCKMLKNVGDVKINTMFDAIIVDIELHGWQYDDNTMQEAFTY